MAPVAVDVGPVSAQDVPERVPREKWRLLVGARKSFVRTNLPFDCRELVRFIDDARRLEMWKELGRASLEEHVRLDLGVDPQTATWAVEGIRVLGVKTEVSLDAAVAAGRAQALAGDPRVEKTLEGEELRAARAEGGKKGGRGNHRADGTKVSRGSNKAETLIRRLKRDAPDVADALARGEYPSARAAGIAAGIVKVPSTLSLLRRAWARASRDERDAFLAEIGTP